MKRFPSRLVAGAVALAVAVALTRSVVAVEVQVEETDAGAKVTVDGDLFAEYVTQSGHQPIIWPIYGPGGQAMTRQFPMGDRLDGEKDDHPHHRSLWFNHGIVNGRDFWLEPGRRGPQNKIVHREFVEMAPGDGTARLVTRNDWMSDVDKVCEDERTIIFGADEHGRWIDFTVVVTASEGDLTFGDTKEGAFGLRVAGTMKADDGGKIRNSEDQEDAVAWGQNAEWVDYSGKVDAQNVGIVVFDLPDSFRHPTRWHVRTYGLFAANPFGQRDFPPGEANQGEVTIAEGESITLHYRVLFYEGDLSESQLAAIYDEYAGED